MISTQGGTMSTSDSFFMTFLQVLQAIAQGEDWTESQRFPRVTMCDFNIRRLGNLQRYTVQCVLPINLFNEKVYLFIWFWLVFVVILSCLSLLSWFVKVVSKSDRHRFVNKHLVVMNKILDDEDHQVAAQFVDNYLQQDGVFTLRLVGKNTNSITATEFTCALWDNYLQSRDHKDI